QMVEIIIAIPTILFCWLDIIFPHPVIFIINTILNILFTLLATGTIIRDVFDRSKVTIQTLKGIVCAYFLVALAFAYIFWLIEYFIPNSSFISPTHQEFYYYTQYLSEMIYFSFVTLLTIGYGDIVAIKNLGQTAVILEGLIGQFYIAILVARLVSAYSFSSQSKDLEKENSQEKTHDSY
ncbi:MAG: two pore domain potassium channel family protein, partial [Verrucomicrobia bacterium]|nr:two pore domain potassium channel family protein [Verrucomicrobiota bacterium]